ncbi:MAG: hypothetical protein Q8Q37_00485 [bacterium]|nr:hypothetical protein [bacterium]
MARGFLLKNNFTKDTLLRIATVGVFILAASTSPYFFHEIVREYFKEKNGVAIRKRVRSLKNLERRKLISFKELTNGTVKIIILHRGRELIRQYNLEDMKLRKPNKWDKKWRLIIYDIPVKQKRASDAFRAKMKNLGLYQLQKSIWVSPYECLSEIEFLCSVFNINMNECVFYFSTNEIPKKQEIEKFFDL